MAATVCVKLQLICLYFESWILSQWILFRKYKTLTNIIIHACWNTYINIQIKKLLLSFLLLLFIFALNCFSLLPLFDIQCCHSSIHFAIQLFSVPNILQSLWPIISVSRCRHKTFNWQYSNCNWNYKKKQQNGGDIAINNKNIFVLYLKL